MKKYHPASPRPEAEPLSPDELTEDQNRVGKDLVGLLQGMAADKNELPVSSTSRHTYLPRLDYGRYNHVLLIDGKRGAGKSALMLTLIAEYERLLAPEIGGSSIGWAQSADYIIPVGIVDLEPLSPATNLLFFLLSHLERVVAAMEETQRPEIPEPGTSWQRAKVVELPSRQRWRELARRIAASWDGNINERKGMLDLKDFVLEREEDEFHRLNLFRSFTAFLDALTADYQRWQPPPEGLNRLPFFLLAIDDADMSAEKSLELLEIVRKFWHRRLGYLLTGDSDLFRDRIRWALEGNVSATMQQNLVEDIYNKAIPKRHRGQLSALTPSERLTRGPRLEYLFLQLIIDGTANVPLTRYFDLNQQARNVLPERPRALYELAALLSKDAKTIDASRYVQTDRLIHQLWNDAITDLPEDAQDRLQSVFHLDPQSGRLQVGSGAAEVYPEWRERDSHACAPSLVLRLGIPHSFGALLQWSTGITTVKIELPANSRAMAGLMLGVDAIDPRTSRQRIPFAPNGLEAHTFAQTEWLQELDPPVVFPWPYPEWQSYAKTLRLAERWGQAVKRRGNNWTVDQMAFAFLSAIVEQCVEHPIREVESSPNWAELAREIVEIAKDRQTNDPQMRANAEWALSRAGLFAAPESGLSQETANQFLFALKTYFGDELWQEARKRLQIERHARTKFPRDVNTTSSKYSDLYQDIDEQFLGHQFRLMTESTESIRQGARAQTISQLASSLYFDLPFGERIWGNQDRDRTRLSYYLWEFRRGLLTQTPRRLIDRIGRELDNYRRISGTTPDALHRFWVMLAEGYNRHDLAEAIHLSNGRLRISKLLLEQVAQRDPKSGRIPLATLPAANDLSFQLFTTSGTTFPLLKADLPRPLDALLRVIFDYVADQDDKRIGKIYWFERGWHGCEVELPGGYRAFPWPVIRWRSLIEAEMLEQSWTEVAQLVTSVSHGKASGAKPRHLEALAYWFIDAIVTLTEQRRDPGTHTNLDVTQTQWINLLERCVQLQHRYKEKSPGQRAGVYNRWLNRLILMATPEAGLSWHTAELIIKNLASRFDTGDAQQQRNILLASSDAAGAQQTLDRQFADHPWVKWMMTERPS